MSRTRKQYIEGMARGVCFLAGIDAIDAGDGSSNWWLFSGSVSPLVDDLIESGVFPVDSPARKSKTESET